MAGAGAYLWEAGEVVTAANLNQYIQDQVVATYADATARDAAYGGSGEPVLAEGMFCFLKDSDTLQYYSGTAWEDVGGGAVDFTDANNIVAVSVFS